MKAGEIAGVPGETHPKTIPRKFHIPKSDMYLSRLEPVLQHWWQVFAGEADVQAKHRPRSKSKTASLQGF